MLAIKFCAILFISRVDVLVDDANYYIVNVTFPFCDNSAIKNQRKGVIEW